MDRVFTYKALRRIFANFRKRSMLRDLTLRSVLLIGSILSLSFLGAYLAFSLQLGKAFRENSQRMADALLWQFQSIIQTESKSTDILPFSGTEHFARFSKYLSPFFEKTDLRMLEMHLANESLVLPAGISGQPLDSDWIIERSLDLHGKTVKIRFFFSMIHLYETKTALLLKGVLVSVGAFFLIVLFDLLTLFFYYRRPVRHLYQGITRIANGDWDYRIPLTYQDDINDVIQHINELAAQFQMHELEMQISNAKHQVFVENSSDIIFSMNEDGILITVNKAIRRHLGYAPSELKGKPFEMLINYDRTRPDDVRLPVYREKLKEVQKNGQGQFKIELLSLHGEPREMNLRLEFMKVHSAYVFWGKLEPLARNVMGRLCVAEYRRFRIGNYLNIADMVLNAITMNLDRYFTEDEAASMKIGVREMIVNAIEHGNLGISYEEKAEATTSETYLRLVTERQKIVPYKERKVEILYSLNHRRVRYFIRDQGAGFDHQKMRESFQVELNRYHGRGIVITDSIFDIVRYNKKGNEVLLIKYTKGEPGKKKT